MRQSSTSLKYRLEHRLFRLAALVLGAMSVEAASGVSGWLWRHLAPLFKRHRRALDHLARALPGLPAAERDAIARAMWENLGRTFGEAFHLERILADGRLSLENRDVFERWASRPGGKVACAGHLANWELAIAGISGRGLEPWSIYQRVKNPLVERDILAMRGFLYTGGLVAKDPTLPRRFLRIVREGGTVGFLGDLRDPGGIAVPFFGRPAPSTTFPAILARSVEGPVLMVCMRRLPGVRFVLSHELIDMPVTADRRSDIAIVTAAIQAAFERAIRAAPDQWMWAHRRWG